MKIAGCAGQVFEDMDNTTGTDHGFLVQIWHPRDLDPHHPDQPAIYLGSPAADAAPTIMVKDSAHDVHSLADINSRLFLPEGQALRDAAFYQSTPCTIPERGYARMRMYVQGAAVPDDRHPWQQAIAAGGTVSEVMLANSIHQGNSSLQNRIAPLMQLILRCIQL